MLLHYTHAALSSPLQTYALVMTCRAADQQQFPSGDMMSSGSLGLGKTQPKNSAQAQKTTKSKAVNVSAQVLRMNKLIKHGHQSSLHSNPGVT